MEAAQMGQMGLGAYSGSNDLQEITSTDLE